MNLRNPVAALALGFSLAPIALVAVPQSAWATVQTGSIAGQVTGTDGTPIPDVTITIEGANMIGGKRTDKTDAQGHYHMVEIPPGTYTLTIEATGYPAKVLTDISINLDRQTGQDVILAVAEAGGQVMTVTDHKPTIDTTQTQGGEVVSQDFLTKLPVGNDYLNVARMVPGVIGTGNSNIQGAADNENQFLVDGVNITDPVTNTFSANFNFESIEQVEVLTGGFDPEHQALGGVINVVTKSGGNDFHGGASYDYHDNQWSPRRGHRCAAYEAGYVPTGNDLADQDHCTDLVEFSERGTRAVDYTTNLWLGGPILRDKIWFFGSYEFAQSLSKDYGVQSPRNYTGNYFQGKLTYQPAPRHKFTLSFQTDPTTITRVEQSPYIPDAAEARQLQGGVLLSLEHLWFATDKIVLRNQFNFKNQYIDFGPNSGDLHTVAHEGILGAESNGNFLFYSFNRRDRLDWSPKLTYYLDNAIGSHELAVGLDTALIREDVTFGYPGNVYFVDRLQKPYDPSSGTKNYYWVETSGPLEQKTNGLQTGIYVQDAWKPSGFNDKLTVRGGLRLDRAAMYNDQGSEVISFTGFSPRLYAAYDLTGDGKTVVRGGYGRFIDPGKLETSDFLNRHGRGAKLFLGDYFTPTPGNGSGDLYFGTDGEASTLRAGKITPPVQDAVRLGFERDLVQQIAVGLTWNAKWTYHLFEDDDSNLIWNANGSQTIGNRNGVVDNRFRIRTPASARRYYQDLEFTLRRRFADQFELLGSYTWSRSTGTTESQFTEALDIPPQNKYDYGYLSNDHPNVVRLSASYDFNFGLTVGSVLNYVTGDRYEHFYWNDFNGGYSNRGAPRLTGGQLPGAPLWDIKFTYGPKLGGLHLLGLNWANAGKLRAQFTIDNILNNRQVAGFQQGPYDDRGVKYIAGRYPPMAFRAGLRYEF